MLNQTNGVNENYSYTLNEYFNHIFKELKFNNYQCQKFTDDLLQKIEMSNRRFLAMKEMQVKSICSDDLRTIYLCTRTPFLPDLNDINIHYSLAEISV